MQEGNAVQLARLAINWGVARRDLLTALGEIDKYTKQKGKTIEVIEPTPLMGLWQKLSDAETELYEALK